MKKITLILITLLAFIYANAQYTVPRGLPYHDTRWIENKGVAGATYLFDSIVMFRNIADTQMKPLYPAMGYLQNFDGDSTLWIWDMVRWKKLGGGGAAVNDRFAYPTEDDLGLLDRAMDMQGFGLHIFSTATVDNDAGYSLTFSNSGLNLTQNNFDNSRFSRFLQNGNTFQFLSFQDAEAKENTIDITPLGFNTTIHNTIDGHTNSFDVTDTSVNIGVAGNHSKPLDIFRNTQTTPSNLTGGISLYSDWRSGSGTNTLYYKDEQGNTQIFSNGSGYIPLTVNGVASDINGAITIPIGGTGTVTSFSAGNLSPLFTSSVATSTTTPALTFSLTNATGGTVFGNNTSSSAAPAYTSVPVLGIAGTTKGTIGFAGNTSGVVTIQPAAAAGTWTFTLPTTGGTNNYVLTTNGGGTTTWTDVTTIATGTVTSVGLTMPSAFTVTNSPVTTSGTLTVTGAGTTSQYIRGDGSLATFSSAAAGSISLTTTGSSGASTYNSSTGVLNVPTYTLAGIGSLDTVNVSNVIAYGADSTGVVDATAAFNNAVNASTLNGKMRVYIPHGTYKITVAALKAGSQANKQGIQLVNNIEIFGDGVGKTTIKAAAQATGDTATYNWYPIFNGFTGSISNVKIHDLSVNGNQANIAIYNANPYVNPTGHNDTSKHYSVQGIYFKDGINNEVYRTQIDSCQGFGVEVYNSFHNKIHGSKFTTNGNGGVGVTERATADVYENFITNNNSDNIRVVNAGDSVVRVYNNDLSWAQSNASATNWFAGIYEYYTKNVIITGNIVHDNSAYGIDLGGLDSSVNGNIIVKDNQVYQNGNGGIITSGGCIIEGNVIHDNGKKSNGVIDTKSNYNPAAIVVSNAPNMSISDNYAFDSISGTQTYFIKKWGGSPAPAFGFMGSNVNNNRIKAVADTAHAYDGDNGRNSIIYNVITTSAGSIVAPAADKNFLTLTNGLPVWGAPFTLTTSGTSGTASFSGGTLNIPNYSGGGGSVALSGITAATGTNTIDNLNFAQEWDASTLSTQTFMTFTGNALTTGNLLSLTSSSTVGNGYSLLNLAASGANGTSSKTVKGQSISVTNTGTTSTNIGLSVTASGATTNYSIQSTTGSIDQQVNGIATTSTDGIIIENTTAAAVNAQQYSPRLNLKGFGWKTTATAGSQAVNSFLETHAIQSTTNPIAEFNLGVQTNANASGNTLTMGSNGVTTLNTPSSGATLYVNGSVSIGNNQSTSTGLLNTSSLALGNQYPTTLTSLISSTTSLGAVTANGISFSLNVTNVAPTTTTIMAGVNSAIQSSGTIVYTAAPAELAGVVGTAGFGTTNSTVVFPLGVGVDGSVNLRTSMAKDVTKGYGLRAAISSADPAPTNRVVYFAGLRVDSVDGRMVWSKPFGLDVRGTNGYSFIANSTLVGNYNNSGNDTANSTLQANGSFAHAYTSTAVDYTATANDCVIEVTATGKTITLPTAVGITGRKYVIKLTASGSSTIATASSQNIDASTTYSLSAQYKYVEVVSNNVGWIIVASN